MKKRTKQYFTAVTIAAMMVSSYGTGVPTMAAKVTLPRTAKVVVGAKKVLKLKNNKRAAKQYDGGLCRGERNSGGGDCGHCG